MNRSESWSSRAELGEQVEHGGLDRDVERGGDFVADEQLGRRRERARDRDALALPPESSPG